MSQPPTHITQEEWDETLGRIGAIETIVATALACQLCVHSPAIREGITRDILQSLLKGGTELRPPIQRAAIGRASTLLKAVELACLKSDAAAGAL
jgi:hypothetical protein